MFKTTIELLRTLFRLCLFRGSPAQLPYSRPLLGGFIAATIASVLVFSHPSLTLGESLLEKTLSTLILVSLLYWLFARKNQTQRLHKTLLAWFGTELIADLLSLIIFGMQPAQEPNAAAFVFLVWLLLVKSYILKQAYTLSLASAFFLLLGILIPASLPLLIILGPQLP